MCSIILYQLLSPDGCVSLDIGDASQLAAKD